MTSEEPTSTERQFETRHIVILLVAAVVLLVALPLGAVSIVSYSGCCLASGPENVITFWASMLAGFLALFGMVVTGVFIITAFKVDATARTEARDEVWRYLENYKVKLAKDLQEIEELVPSVNEASANAQRAITSARKATDSAAQEAQAEVARLREGVQREREEAIGAITSARQEVEAAATAAQERINQIARGLRQEEDPERSDE